LKKRSRISILIEVLEFIESEGGETIATKIATATGLAYDRLIVFLEDLSKRGIVSIETSGRNRIIRLSDKGYHLLRRLRELRDLIRDLGLDIR